MSILSEQDADELTEFCAQKAAVDDENDLFHLVGAIVARHEAEALRAAADAFQMNTWADVILPALKTEGLPALAVGQAVIDWLRARAASVEAQGGAE